MSTKIQTSLTVDEWEKAERECGDAEGWAARFLALAKEPPHTAGAEAASWWILAYFPETKCCKEAVEIVSRDYSEKFPDLCRSLIQPSAPFADHHFRAIIEKSPNRQMRGQATLARARFRQTVMHDNATAEKLLKQAVAEFADIRISKYSSATLGEVAKSELINLQSPPPKAERFHSSGYFTHSDTIGVYWSTWLEPQTNQIRFVILLPEMDQVDIGRVTMHHSTDEFCNLKMKRSGHEWRIESSGTVNMGVETIRFFDKTANTVTNLDLRQSRLWRLSDNGILTPIEKLDPDIAGKILSESESRREGIDSLRDGK
jgi:hypothetical protein